MARRSNDQRYAHLLEFKNSGVLTSAVKYVGSNGTSVLFRIALPSGVVKTDMTGAQVDAFLLGVQAAQAAHKIGQ